MKIVGLHHQVIVNTLIIVAIVATVIFAKNELALLGLAFVQPATVSAVGDQNETESEPAIGFTADID